MENVRQHHVLHNFRCHCSQERQAIPLHKRVGVVQHPWHMLNGRDISFDKGRTDIRLLT